MATSTLLRNEPNQGGFPAQVEVQELLDTIKRNSTALYRKAYHYMKNAADAEDTVQEALLLACKHLDQFKGEAQLATWLNTIVANAARQALRRRPRCVHVSIDPAASDEDRNAVRDLPDPGSTPEQACQRRELTDGVNRSIRRLTPAARKAFELRAFEGLTTRETASAMGVSESSVKAHLTRARTRLKSLRSSRVA